MKKLFILAALFILSCNKEIQYPERVSGLITIEDKTTPLYTSGATTSVQLRGKPVKDVIKPTVQILSPSNNSVVEGIVTVQVIASDNIGIKTISISVNGVTISSISDVSSYNFGLNTDPYAGKTITITASAYDRANNSSLNSIVVSVKNKIIIEPPSTGYELKTPPIINQGSEGSCVGMAVGYYARSIEEYYIKGATSFDNTQNVFSPEHLYIFPKA